MWPLTYFSWSRASRTTNRFASSGFARVPGSISSSGRGYASSAVAQAHRARNAPIRRPRVMVAPSSKWAHHCRASHSLNTITDAREKQPRVISGNTFRHLTRPEQRSWPGNDRDGDCNARSDARLKEVDDEDHGTDCGPAIRSRG